MGVARLVPGSTGTLNVGTLQVVLRWEDRTGEGVLLIPPWGAQLPH